MKYTGSYTVEQCQAMDDEALMQLAGRGEEQAFEALYDRYSSRMLHFFLRMLGGDVEKAQDFVQDLFIKIIDNRHLFRREARFCTWLYTIASNMCKNEYRRMAVRRIMIREPQPDMVFAADTSDSGSQIDQEQFRKRVNKILETLDPSQKITFLLRYQEGLTLREISDILGVATGTVKSRLHYVSKKLAANCRDYAPDKERDNYVR